MRLKTSLFLFWFTGLHQTMAMLAILRATYYLKYNKNEDSEIFFTENITTLENKKATSAHDNGVIGLNDDIKNRM
jgi:cellobiose-specific phosphotransferase system component IIC